MTTDSTTDTSSSAGKSHHSRLPRRLACAAFGVAIVVLLLVWPYQNWQFEARSSILSGWLKAVLSDSEWMFCLAVPPIVAYLIYSRRAEFRGLSLQGHWIGALVFGIGLLFYWMGYKVNTGYLGFIAAQLLLGGLILLLGGLKWMRALFFPWLFLSFMWPMFPLEERLAFPLRMITANVSGQFLNLVGLDVVREGTALYSAPDPAAGLAQGDRFMLDVEEPCSGIRSLFALMMVSALYGYLNLRSPVSRLILFLSAIPLAMAGNFVRMILLAFGSSWFGAEFAVGRNIDGHQEMSFFHTMAGYAVFAVALGGMFAICSLLERKHWKRFGKAHKRTTTTHGSVGETMMRRHLVFPALALLLTGAGIAWCAATETDPKPADAGVALTLPLQFHTFQGRDIGMTAQERDILDPGVELARTFYANASGRRVLATVIVGGPGKRTLHRPEVCLPGQGWNISSTAETEVELADGRTITATLLRLFRDQEGPEGQRMRIRAFNLYWYVGSDGSTAPDYYGHIGQGYRDAIFRNLNHRWSMISIFAPVSEAVIGKEDPFLELGALDEIKTFVAELAPEIMTSGAPATTAQR